MIILWSVLLILVLAFDTLTLLIVLEKVERIRKAFELLCEELTKTMPTVGKAQNVYGSVVWFGRSGGGMN